MRNLISMIILALAVVIGTLVPGYAQTTGLGSYTTIGVVALSVLIGFGLLAARFKLISVEVKKTPETATLAPVSKAPSPLAEHPNPATITVKPPTVEGPPQPALAPVTTKPTGTMEASDEILSNHEAELARSVESLTREREQLLAEKSRLQEALEEVSRLRVDQTGGYGAIVQELAKTAGEPLTLETARLRERYLMALVEIERLRNDRKASMGELDKLRQSLTVEREELRLMREELLSVLTRFQDSSRKA